MSLYTLANLAFHSSVLLLLVHLSNSHQMCKETKHGVDVGLIRVPDFHETVPLNVSCEFTYSAPPGKRLLVKVDSVHLPPSEIRESTLKLLLDEDVIDIPRNCVRNCLKNVVSGRFVQIIYKSTTLSNDSSYAKIVGSFQIRYKSFDPSLCDKPPSLKNGFATVLGRKLGQETKYHCKRPYELVGKSRTICQVGPDSPVPDWNQGPPKCVVPNCTGVPFVRRAGAGAISSPGYPSYRIDVPMNCEWVITAERGYQISSSVTFMELSSMDGNGPIGCLRLYDGPDRRTLAEFNETSEGAVQNRTTQSNVLTVSFITSNTGMAESGFFLEYAAFPGACKEPDKPKFGQIVGYSFGVGSNVVFRCAEGYLLEGNSTSECKEDGSWSSETPVCVVADSGLSVNTMLDDDSTPERSGEPLKDSVSSPANETTTSTPGENSTDAMISTKVTKPSKKFSLTSKSPVKTTPRPKMDNPGSASPTNASSTRSYGNVKSYNYSDSDSSPSSSNGLEPKEKFPDKTQQSARGPKGLAKPNEVDEHHILPGRPKQEDSEEMSSLMLYGIIGSSVAAFLILIAILTALVVYRKRFPVRMRFGRKFSTFENPMYSAKEQQDRDAQHPRELKRLNPDCL